MFSCKQIKKYEKYYGKNKTFELWKIQTVPSHRTNFFASNVETQF